VTHPMLKYLKESGPSGARLPTILCPGCGAGQVLNYTLHAVDEVIKEDRIPRERFLFVSGIGCSSRLTAGYLNFDSAWTLHGRAPAVATGALLANPELRVVVFTGDGDLAAIGGNHFIHVCRRNLAMTIVCMNNGLYGMTGGQVAPTTPRGDYTTTTPYGNVERAFDLCTMAMTAGASYVARWTTAHARQTIRAIKRGMRKKGTAFVEILCQCPTHAKKPAIDLLRAFKTSTVPLRKIEKGDGRIAIGEFLDIEQPEWIASYQRIVDSLAEGD